MKYSLNCTNGDPFYIMGYVANAMRECGMSNADIDAYSKKASSGDYDRLVRVSIVMIDKCNKIYDKQLYEKV